LKILVISEYFFPKESGAEKNVRLYLEDLLLRYNVTATVLTKKIPGRVQQNTQYVLNAGFFNFRFLNRFTIFFEYLVNSLVLLKYLRQNDTDIINTIGYNAFFLISVIAGKLTKTRVVLVMCTSDIYELKRNKYYHYLAVKFASRHCDYFFSKSIGKDPMQIELSIPEEKFETIPNPAYRAIIAPRREGVGKSGKLVIGYTGKLHKLKNTLELIKMIEILDKNKYVLCIVGSGPLKKELISQIEEKKLNSNVFLFEHTNDVTQYLEKFDIYIFPTCYEPAVSQAMMEAMLCQLPVIVKRSKNLELWFKDRIDCFMVDKCNYVSFASAVEILGCNTEMRKSLGRCAKSTILENHKIEKFTSKLMDRNYKLTCKNKK